MIEIERKFLVNSIAYKKQASSKTRIEQGFLNTHKERTVRVRIMGDKGFITVKGISNASGTSRFEWEKEIPVLEASSLLKICEKGILQKYRYCIPSGEHIIEVDEFLGENQGLVVAEIELKSEEEKFIRPDWLGARGDGRYQVLQLPIEQTPF